MFLLLIVKQKMEIILLLNDFAKFENYFINGLSFNGNGYYIKC